jgi:ADP-ribosyl-[dinitrogen reductase] hydrolase
MPTTALERLVDDAAGSPVNGEVLRDRYRGVMLGVAVGNALGTPAEGESQHAIRRHWPQRLTEIDTAERDRPWDDDLAQTALLAEALLRTDDLNPDYFGQQLVRWSRENGRGIGLLTREVVTQIESGTPALDAARAVWERSGWSTAGNGAVMRCSPVALRCRTSGSYLVRTARTSARMTHYDGRCEWSTVSVSVALAQVLAGRTPDVVQMADALEEVEAREAESAAMEQVLEAVRPVGDLSLADLQLDDPMDMGYTLKAMRVALWCSLRDESFESVVTDIVNAGGDTDTNGAVAGAVMGARHGAADIPTRWVERVPEVDRLTGLADGLLEASQAS